MPSIVMAVFAKYQQHLQNLFIVFRYRLYLSLKFITMPTKEAFIQAIKNGYTFKGESVKIGAAVLDGEVVPDAGIYLPLKTLNRHGLIAGASGTG